MYSPFLAAKCLGPHGSEEVQGLLLGRRQSLSRLCLFGLRKFLASIEIRIHGKRWRTHFVPSLLPVYLKRREQQCRRRDSHLATGYGVLTLPFAFPFSRSSLSQKARKAGASENHVVEA